MAKHSTSIAPRAPAAGPQLSGTNHIHAGDHNQRVTLHAVRVNGPVTRVELVKTTGLTPPAIANITSRLLKDGLILRAGSLRGGRGQPATKYVINAESYFSLGLNVDRDHMTLVLLDFLGKVRARASREIAFAKPAAVKRFFSTSVSLLLAKSGVASSQLLGVGIAFPDDILHAHLPDQPEDYAAWATVKIDHLLRNVLDIPVYTENDAAAAAIGEMQFGLGHRYRSFFYILITAALGGGLVIDGHYFRGADGRSGEIGWLHGRNRDGDTAELQHIVSLSGLYSRLAEGGFRVAKPRDLEKLAPEGHHIVNEWISQGAQTLTESIQAVNCLINPEAILIGGRLPGLLIDRLATALNTCMSTRVGQMPAIAPVERAALSEDAPAVGAAILPFDNRLLPSRFALLKAT